MASLNLRRLFLYVLIGSVVVSALIGIFVLLLGDFGEFETKILLTALTVTVTSVLGLACGTYLETGKAWVVPVAGIIFSVLSAVLWIIMLWSNFDPENETFGRTVMTATILAFACSHLSLLSLARLDRRFAWSRIAAHIFVWSLAGLNIFIIWADVDLSEKMLARIEGVLSIVIAALTVMTPVFHRLSSTDDNVEKIDAEIISLKERIAELEEKRARMNEK